ncbi:DUF1501 domain-containing protein [Singulisphaera acidiphila]|uniref:DUF1501 domain-containing protein n=1 Tax=Singulisphaera acidiphila (strain ATCC BAA-1392 / DSM 18658 / VKM B-2454 / MOB10) TaxID=886293 RepID=L0DNZ0_SINAD|nr:DUF1501 domain-containing protein [Singulisphaera acidiphila]AGA31094.1 hypothetical protein Sinac_7039 [Singulisphaera acidiphila DSM 18658]
MASDRRVNFCGSPAHALDRRRFLGTAAAGAAAFAADMTVLDVLKEPALAREIKSQGKRVILLWLAGGASQLETWDPKPGTATGGPFRAISTSVPGIQISELMPKMAKRMEQTCIIRSLNTKNGDHGSGARLMMRGRMDDPSLRYPDLGAVLARELGRSESQVPDYVSFYSATEGRDFAPGSSGFLGSRYAPMELTTSLIPENIRRAAELSDLDHRQRGELRELLSKRFERGRTSNSALGGHNEAYQRVRGLMASETLFDLSKEPQRVRDLYGPTQFGEQALVARRLIEAGVPFVRVGRAWWDSHGQNFETHQELVPELDHVMATLLDDLDQRGLLDQTLVITLAEFGRTPSINPSLGRDHFATAWSATLSGCGIKGGSVFGKTDATGNAVVDGEVGAAELFATIYQALGIDPQKNYYVNSRPVPLTEPDTEAIADVLA